MLVSGTGSEHALRFGGGGGTAVASSCPLHGIVLLAVAGTCPQPNPSPSAGSGRSPIHVELTPATFESPEISIRRVGGTYSIAGGSRDLDDARGSSTGYQAQ